MPPRLDYWIRRSPFFDAACRAGASGFAIANHMYQPNGYDDAVAEYWKLVEGVVLWDVGTERQVQITGADAARFVSRLTPRDLARVPVGRCRYSLVTSAEGGIVDDPVVLRLAEDRYWMSTSDSDLLLWAQGVAVHAGMDVHIDEPDVSPVQVQGPRSRAVIEALLRVAREGVRRRLVGIDLGEQPLAGDYEARWPVFDLRAGGDEAALGAVTIAVYSPRLRRAIGYAWVPVTHAALDTALRVRTPWGEREARVAARRFLDED